MHAFEARISGEEHDGALALLVGKPRDAIAALEKAPAANDAALWSDLAAAYYETAARDDTPQLLTKALAAADRALAIEPDRAEALFNRALILERLALRVDAHAAWSRYLAAESVGEWPDVARDHLRRVAPERPFDEVLEENYDRIGRDPAAAAALYEQDRFAARGRGVVEILGRWGDARARGDEDDAIRHANVARQLGRVVARGGDRTLEHAVAAIDRTGDRYGSDASALAAAHADFRRGMEMFGKSRPEAAEPLLRRAASVFRRIGSPAAIPASLWAANSVYERGLHVRAEKEIEALLESTPADYPAYRGFMLWQLANCRNARGDWGAAIDLYEKSVALFEALGESGNVANVRSILAGVYEKIGDADAAWDNRLSALRSQGIRSSAIDERTVWFLAEAAITRRDWSVALSLLTVYADVVRRLPNYVELANALLLRAVVRDRLDNAHGASEDIEEARRAASQVADSSYQELLLAAEWRCVAMLRSTPAATSEALLTSTIEYESTLGNRSSLPGLLLLRARARRRANDLAGALEDVTRGIERLEEHRESLPAGTARWGAFHSAEELFEEGVELALIADDPEAAFRFTERARARTLLESYGASPAVDWRAIPSRTVIVEYAALPSSLVVFAGDARGVTAVTVNVQRDVLLTELQSFIDALRGNTPPEMARYGASLYRRLIAPIESRLADVETVVFVPDGVTSRVPFGALVDARGGRVVERHAVVVSPSAAAFTAASERRRRMPAPRTALVLTASGPGSDAARLRFVEAEARRILRQYPATMRIDEQSPQRDELFARAQDADAIHFAGHAVGDERGYQPASIVLRNGDEERRVTAAEIAKLRLNRTGVVVLAGCSTARGERRAAEGVISVAHGFLSAGVPSTIATLWPINDAEAAVFFPRLHQKLASGLAPADALRAVQLEALRRGDVPPALWAAVQAIGS